MEVAGISNTMTVDPSLSDASVAKTCEYALRFRLIDHHAIRCWGDEMILSLDPPQCGQLIYRIAMPVTSTNDCDACRANQ